MGFKLSWWDSPPSTGGLPAAISPDKSRTWNHHDFKREPQNDRYVFLEIPFPTEKLVFALPAHLFPATTRLFYAESEKARWYNSQNK